MALASDEELRKAGEALSLRSADTVAMLRALCSRYPDDVRTHFLLGAMLERSGLYADSLKALDQTLQLDADHVQALSAKALVLQALGRSGDACSLLVKAVSRHPANGQLWTNLGAIREATGDFEGALQAYDEALAQSDFPWSARLNRGYVLTRLGRLEEALENNSGLAESYPDNAEAHFNVAEVLLALQRHEEAADACDRALAIRPDYPKALIDRSLARAALGQVTQAQQDLDRAREISPESLTAFNLGFAARAGGLLQDFGAYSIYFHLNYERLEQCDWTHREELVRSIADFARKTAGTSREIADPNIPFRTLGFDIDQGIQQALAKSVASAIEARARSRIPPSNNRPLQPTSRIRVGYVSPDFRIHPASFLTRSLYAGHDRSRFEILGYALTPDDGSWIRREVQSGFDVFRDVGGFDAGTIARQIQDDGIDILVDLAGLTNFSRSEVFALKPAPLQVNWLGYPGTLGAGYMDYALVDGFVCPAGTEVLWTENLVRLPNCYFITDNNPRVDAFTPSRAEMGLPDKGFVFCCFNNAWKIEPIIFSVWMDLLKQVQGSVLWLLAFRGEVVQNLKREAVTRGVDPDRLVFGGRLPNESHLPRYRLADLFLDTLQYNAHTTAIDALREATPLLTVPGKTMPSRAAASLVSAAGVPELICKDLEAYRARAIELANRPQELARLRSLLQENRGKAPLFDTARFIRNMESAFQLMWKRRLQGLPAQAFDVTESPLRPISNRWF